MLGFCLSNDPKVCLRRPSRGALTCILFQPWNNESVFPTVKHKLMKDENSSKNKTEKKNLVKDKGKQRKRCHNRKRQI